MEVLFLYKTKIKYLRVLLVRKTVISLKSNKNPGLWMCLQIWIWTARLNAISWTINLAVVCLWPNWRNLLHQSVIALEAMDHQRREAKSRIRLRFLKEVASWEDIRVVLALAKGRQGYTQLWVETNLESLSQMEMISQRREEAFLKSHLVSERDQSQIRPKKATKTSNSPVFLLRLQQSAITPRTVSLQKTIK